MNKMVCIFGAIKKIEIQTTNLTLNSIIKSIVVEIVQNTCTCICKTCIPIWNSSGCLHCAHFLLYKCINVYDFCLQGNFFHNLGSILVFAILGTVVSALVVGGGIYLLGQVPVLFFYWISNNLKYWSIYLYLKKDIAFDTCILGKPQIFHNWRLSGIFITDIFTVTKV